jgi:hypothetical protein
MFDKTGLKQVYVAEKLDIEPRTLQNWLKMKDIEFTVKFIQLLHICNIHTCDFLNMYYKTDEYECKYCKLKK